MLAVKIRHCQNICSFFVNVAHLMNSGFTPFIIGLIHTYGIHPHILDGFQIGFPGHHTAKVIKIIQIK
ncbi:hypothetical protein BCR42DRAFT_430468 [Absidia repens]|uniref:Uncharacterized protein n=1 Tax=Absidia repens TaxID=90262 RepID=A0A1X2HDV5_9FUNG|nr:hypothetical protein BCR42DRAFT_430468 [Absidia repens]